MPSLRDAGAAISVCGLVHRYGSAEVLKLDSWQVAAAESWLVLGPSGSGKSTLLHLLSGLARVQSGRVEVDGADLAMLPQRALDRFRAASVGIVLQALHLVPHLSARDNIRLARYLAGLAADDAAVDGALAALGMQDKAARRPSALSQGERQRVAIARAVVNEPRLLLADEPTANLDDVAAENTLDLLEGQARRHGATLIVATHDQRVKARFARQLVLAAT